MKIVDKCKERVEKARCFVKKHKAEILFGAAGAVTIGTTIGSVRIFKKLHDIDRDSINTIDNEDLSDNITSIIDKMSKDYFTNKKEISNNIKLVDESIFTDLAPEIESCVISDNEKTILERSYTLAPTLHKMVTVSVESVYGD